MLPKYEITYGGKQPLDELSAYFFTVKPRAVERAHAYFSGVVWVDVQDLVIVKTMGKWVTETRRRHRFRSSVSPSSRRTASKSARICGFPRTRARMKPPRPAMRACRSASSSSGPITLRRQTRPRRIHRRRRSLRIKKELLSSIGADLSPINFQTCAGASASPVPPAFFPGAFFPPTFRRAAEGELLAAARIHGTRHRSPPSPS